MCPAYRVGLRTYRCSALAMSAAIAHATAHVHAMTSAAHQPVMLAQVLAALQPQAGGVFVDGTFGRGGHSDAILQGLGAQGQLYAFDKDPQACAHAWQCYAGDARLHMQRGSFAGMAAVLEQAGLLGQVDGILLDLGVSSPQLDDARRGFSFSHDGPLDMRMDPHAGMPVAEWLASAKDHEIADVLWRYGDERHSRRIARAIVQAREQAPLETTARLAEVIAAARPQGRVRPGQRRIHPATRSFQALRIHINNELQELEAVLPQLLQALKPGGRVAVISFHSLEDRMVKRFFRNAAQPPHAPIPSLPDPKPTLKLLGRAQHADATELLTNPRARSAVLRVAQRLEA